MITETNFSKGCEVWTHTQSGEPIRCEATGERDHDGSHFLRSPAHGHTINRWDWECGPTCETLPEHDPA